jgi:hypothetical protein
MLFGLCWAALFVLTNFGLALGHPGDPENNSLEWIFWGEIVVFVIGAALFYRAEMRDSDV